MPPRALASGPKPCGGNDLLRCASCLLLLSPFNKILLCIHSDESSNTSCGADLIERHCLCGERLEREGEREGGYLSRGKISRCGAFSTPEHFHLHN